MYTSPLYDIDIKISYPLIHFLVIETHFVKMSKKTMKMECPICLTGIINQKGAEMSQKEPKSIKLFWRQVTTWKSLQNVA